MLVKAGGREETILAFCLLGVFSYMQKEISSSVKEDFIRESGSLGASILRVSHVFPKKNEAYKK